MTVVQTDAVRVARFTCRPGDRRWRESNCIGSRPHVVLPGTAVWIDRGRAGEQVADASRLMLYDADQEYRRRLLDPRGDTCVYVELHPDLLDDLTRGWSRRIGALSPPVLTSAAVTLQRLVSLPDAAGDPPAAEEQVIAAVGDLLAPLRSGAQVEHRREPRVEAVRSVLATDLARPLRLPDLAATVQLSSFHLLRWFKSVTGVTPIAYRARLRVLAAVSCILRERDAPLDELACELGFSSHSHLSAAVRRETGSSPTVLRQKRR